MAFSDFLDNLLSFGRNKSGQKDILHITGVKRPENFEQDYAIWLKAKGYRDLVQRIRSKEIIDSVFFHADKTGNYLRLNPSIFLSDREVFYFAEYIKQVLRKPGYILFKNEVKYTLEYPAGLERIHLRPPFVADRPYEQIFGNVLMEINLQNLEFKLFNTFYSGFNYKPPQPWDELLDYVEYG